MTEHIGPYPVIVCDSDGFERPEGKLHWAVTDPDGVSIEGTCPTLLASGAWFVAAEPEALRNRNWCKHCIKALEPAPMVHFGWQQTEKAKAALRSLGAPEKETK